jgi:FkbM family methyltransferase
MTNLVKQTFRRFGFEVSRVATIPPATPRRPVGDLAAALEDLRARGFDCREAIDVGANRCAWSEAVAAVFPEARFHMFEPVRAFEAGLAAFVKTHPGSTYRIAAAGASDGEIEFDEVTTADGGTTPGSSALATHHAAGYRTTRVKVPAVALGSLAARGELPAAPDLLKIDVEGFELQVLSGCGPLLGAAKAIQLEASLYPFWGQPLLHEVLAYMAGHGYLLYDFVGFNRRPRDGALGQADVLFVCADSELRRGGGYDDMY